MGGFFGVISPNSVDQIYYVSIEKRGIGGKAFNALYMFLRHCGLGRDNEAMKK